MSIYYTKQYGHIDLDKIISVSDAKFSGGGQYVGFDIIVQGRDEAINIGRTLNDDERRWIGETGHQSGNYWEILTTQGLYKRFIKINKVNESTVAQTTMQAQVDHLVNAWETHCIQRQLFRFA